MQKAKLKGKHITIIFILFLIVILGGMGVFRFFWGSITIRTKEEDYCNFTGFLGYSNLQIFPSDSMVIDATTNYYYCCMDTFMDPTCKILMECSFDDEEIFKRECERLSQIVEEEQNQINKVLYSETLFQYPAYITIYEWSSCYEYALIVEEQQKIVYVFLQGNTQKVQNEYMPVKGVERTNPYSIYSFNGKMNLKYR